MIRRVAWRCNTRYARGGARQHYLQQGALARDVIFDAMLLMMLLRCRHAYFMRYSFSAATSRYATPAPRLREYAYAPDAYVVTLRYCALHMKVTRHDILQRCRHTLDVATRAHR